MQFATECFFSLGRGGAHILCKGFAYISANTRFTMPKLEHFHVHTHAYTMDVFATNHMWDMLATNHMWDAQLAALLDEPGGKDTVELSICRIRPDTVDTAFTVELIRAPPAPGSSRYDARPVSATPSPYPSARYDPRRCVHLHTTHFMQPRCFTHMFMAKTNWKY
jgi:hypothetical protein